MVIIGKSNAIIYECKNKLDGQINAIKFYKTEIEEDVQNFYKEAKILHSIKESKIRHPNILPVKELYYWEE